MEFSYLDLVFIYIFVLNVYILVKLHCIVFLDTKVIEFYLFRSEQVTELIKKKKIVFKFYLIFFLLVTKYDKSYLFRVLVFFFFSFFFFLC